MLPHLSSDQPDSRICDPLTQHNSHKPNPLTQHNSHKPNFCLIWLYMGVNGCRYSFIHFLHNSQDLPVVHISCAIVDQVLSFIPYLMDPLLTALAALVLCYVFYVKHARSSKYLRLPPSPPSRPLIGHLLDFPKEKPWRKFKEWSHQCRASCRFISCTND